jgi:hypothetical protein
MLTTCTTCFNNQQLFILYLWVSYDSHNKQLIFSLNRINQLIFEMAEFCVFFAVRAEFLNII